MKKLKTWFLFISLILLIFLRFVSARPVYKNGDKVRISATVLTEPVRYESSQYFKTGGLKIYLPIFPEISYGDKIVVEGIVKDGKLDGVKILEISGAKKGMPVVRNKIISFYQSTLPEPYAGLTAGITLGSKGGLSPDFWERVKKTGVAHVVVASGMNVTFVASFLMGVASVFLPRRKSILFVISGIVLYLFLSGFEAPLVRAAIMGIIAFLAQAEGRLITAWRALALSALIMLLVNPHWTGDLGFILSFVATGSLLIFERKIQNKLMFVPQFLREGLSTSLAAQIGVTPILFVTFGQFNILSPLINALVLWTVPFIMIFGAIGGVLGLILPAVGKLVLYFSYPLLWWFGYIVTFFSF